MGGMFDVGFFLRTLSGGLAGGLVVALVHWLVITGMAWRHFKPGPGADLSVADFRHLSLRQLFSPGYFKLFLFAANLSAIALLVFEMIV